MNTEELRIYLRTIADTKGIEDTQRALRQTQQSAKSLTGAGIAGGLAAEAANRLSEAIGRIGEVYGASINAAREHERVIRATSMAYGQAADSFQRFAAQLSAQTGFTSDAILQAALSARTLSQNYGLTIEQTQKLIRVSADLARVRGIGIAESFERVQSAIRGEAEAAEYLGLTLNDTYLTNQAMNGSLRTTFGTMNDLQKAQVRYNELLRQSAQFTDLAKSSTDSLDAAFGRAEVSLNRFQITLGKVATGPTLAGLDIFTKVADAFEHGFAGFNDANAQRFFKFLEYYQQLDPLQASNIVAVAEAFRKADQEIYGFGTRTGRRAQQTALEDELETQRRVLQAHDEARVAAIRAGAAARAAMQAAAERVVPAAALNQADAIIRRLTADMDLFGQRASALGTILSALPVGDILLRAGVQAQQAMERIDQAVTARLAAAEKLRRARELEEGATRVFDPRDAPGQAVALRRLAQFDQLDAAYRELQIAQKAQTDLQQQAVNLAAQEASIRLGMLPAQQRMAELQRQMTEQQIAARRAALPATEALEDLQYLQQRAELISQNRAASVEERIAARRELRGISRALPGAELAALEARRGVTLAGRPAERFGMDQQLFEITTQRQLEQITQAQTTNGLLQQIAGQRTQAIELTINLGTDEFQQQIFRQLIEANTQAQGPTTIPQSGVRRG